MSKAPHSINLQVWRCGTVPPFVDLLCDHGAAHWAALLAVKPQRDAFVTEYMLHRGEATTLVAYGLFLFLMGKQMITVGNKGRAVNEVNISDGHEHVWNCIVPPGFHSLKS